MAKVTLDIQTNAPVVLEGIANANQEVAVEAKKAGEAQKKAFTDSDSAAKKETKTLQGLKKEIRDITAAAIAAGEGTEEFARNIALAGQKKADLRDLQQAITALDPDRLASGFLGVARAGAGAFSVIESGAALAGARSEQLQLALLKVQAAQGLLAGLQELANSKDVIAQLKIIALQKLRTLETQRGIVAIEGATVAQRLFNLAATPAGFFAILGAIAAVTAAVIAYTRETKISTQAEIERSRALDGTIIKNEELRKSYNEHLIKLSELNNEYLVFTGVLTETEAAIDNVKTKLREAQQENSNNAKAQIEETKGFLNTLKNIGLALLSGNLAAAEGNRLQQTAAILRDQAQKDTQAAAKAEEELFKIEVERQKKQQEDEKKAIEKRKQMKELELKQQKERLDRLIKDNKFAFGFITDQEEALANELLKQNDKKLQDAINFGADQVVAEDAKYKALLEKTIKFYEEKAILDEAAAEKERQLQAQRREAILSTVAVLQTTLQGISDINTIRVDNEIKEINAVKDAEIAAIDQRIEAANKLGLNTEALDAQKRQLEDAAAKRSEALRKKEFERQKKFQKAQAIISGALAVTNALATVPFIPAGLAAAIAAGVEVAFQLAKIEESTFRKGGYTGDGHVDQAAGTVHKREFVSTAETTEKHRPLLEALHNDDYSGLTPMDLDPILRGTGVVLHQDAIGKMNKDGTLVRQMESERRTAAEVEMRSMNRNFRRFINIYKQQPIEKVMPDGSRVIKTGNTTRIIKKRNE